MRQQLNKFRALYFNKESANHSEPMVDNYRPVQHLNDRSVSASFDFDTDGATGLTQCGLTFTLATLLAVCLWLRK